ncbi:hypothetical protein TorRG33x02_298830 [Trema orientale]|uniref:Acyl-CoA N-acyltransferase n=1 Tax=Trema orientale TaxID=63057 RepID=A0A2P5C3D5_TREOI|nr:hypothetical protein TorRG33x02_298830 [Trema orientale]
MSTISIHRVEFLSFSHGRIKSHRRIHRTHATWTMTMDSKSQKRKMEEISLQYPSLAPHIPQHESSKAPDLQFDRLQPSEQDLIQEKRLQFGHFVAREAMLDEEYWTAAWLRAESHWEDRLNERCVLYSVITLNVHFIVCVCTKLRIRNL